MRLAELLRVHPARRGRADRGRHPRNGAHGGALRHVRLAPRPRLPRRVRHADGRPLLHELDRDGVHAREPRVSAALEAVRTRRSWSKVTDEAPTHAELLTLVSAAGRVADHSSLRPWRIIELRGPDREVLGRAI